MAITTNATLENQLTWTRIDTETAVRITDDGNIGADYTLSAGTGVGQVNQLWHTSGTLISGAETTYDLTSLQDSFFGNSVTVSFDGGVVNSLSIENTTASGSSSTDFIVIGPSGTNGFSQPFGTNSDVRLPVYTSGTLSLMNAVSGYEVSSTIKDIVVTNSGNSTATYDLAIIGQV